MRLKNRGLTLVELLLALAVIGIIVFVFFRGALSLNGRSDAVRSAETMGFSEVEVTSAKYVAVGWRGCGQDDSVAYDLTAKNPAGNKVNVLVCCGMMLKGCTVRTQ